MVRSCCRPCTGTEAGSENLEPGAALSGCCVSAHVAGQRWRSDSAKDTALRTLSPNALLKGHTVVSFDLTSTKL